MVNNIGQSLSAALITADNGRKMPKSSYPNKIDSSIELPIVRNNVTEINSEIINSLRDAIIQIEKTLGINPNGSSTLSERLLVSIDNNGELKKEAFDKAGVIYGPITNEVVSDFAAIEESKLKLTYPTVLLQSEFSLVKKELDNLILVLNEIEAKLSTHLLRTAVNVHNSDNISVNTISSGSSETAALSFSSGTLSDVLTDIFHGHIGFSGATSEQNNSHLASQIFFNNENVLNIITQNNLQGAVEELSLSNNNLLKTNIFNTNSNGICRQSKILDIVNGVDGGLKLDSTSVSYSATTNGEQIINISTPIEPLFSLEKYDIVEITSSVTQTTNRYLLLDFTTSLGLITSITVLNGSNNDSDATSQVRILKNPYQISNINSYNTVVRPRYNRTNTPDIIVAHPSSATVTTNNFSAEKINLTKSNISFEVDGVLVEIPVFNSSRGDTNSIDEIILNINEYCSDNKIPIFAYKIRSLSCYEIAISHVIPSWIDSSKNRTIIPRISSSNDCSEEFGIMDFINVEFYGSYGNSILINGSISGDPSTVKMYSSDDLSLVIGSNNIEFLALNPISEGIKIGNLCYIDGNGLYRISSIDENSITLDDQGSTFSIQISNTDKVFIIKNTISLEQFELSEIVGSNGSLILDLFMTDDFQFGAHIRAAIQDNLKSNLFSGIIYDISSGYSIDSSDEINISVNGIVTVFDGSSTSSGDQVYGSGDYIIRSPSGTGFYRMKTNGVLPLLTTLSITVNGYSELPMGLIHLSRCIYSTAFGNVIGEDDIGVPSLIDRRPSGNVNEVIISPSVIEKYVSGPRGELRSDGVVSGLSYSFSDETATDCKVSINPGFYYNIGIRYKFNGVVDLPITHNGSDFFIGFDKDGCLRIGNTITDPITSNSISPFFGERMTYLAYVIPDLSGTLLINDLRKSISLIDKKINEIIVSQDEDYGHFTSIKDAVAYARYYKMFNKVNSIPSILIKNGTYEIDETIILDFDISISGSGPSTILKPSNNLLSNSSSESLLLSHYDSAMFLIGSSDIDSANQSSNFVYGVRISNLTCTYHDNYSISLDSNFNILFLITQGISNSSDIKLFKFDNITFDGSSSMSESTNNTPGSLDGTRQIIPICFGVASDSSGTIPSNYGNLMVNNCIYNYIGTGWSLMGSIISFAGTYNISNVVINNNIIRKASPSQNTVSSGEYYIFNSSTNYVMSGFTYPTTDSVTLTMTQISINGNVISD